MSIPKKPLNQPDKFIAGAAGESRPENPVEKPTKKLLIEVDYELWRALKFKALQENKKLKDLLVEILRESVR